MKELEKILEEIEEELNSYESDHAWNYAKGLEHAAGIVRKHMNYGWIPVEERVPENDVDVLITYMDINGEDYMGIDITTYGYAFLGGNKLDYKEWRNPFPYFKGNYKVTAWMPLPEPYRTERSGEE